MNCSMNQRAEIRGLSAYRNPKAPLATERKKGYLKTVDKGHCSKYFMSGEI